MVKAILARALLHPMSEVTNFTVSWVIYCSLHRRVPLGCAKLVQWWEIQPATAVVRYIWVGKKTIQEGEVFRIVFCAYIQSPTYIKSSLLGCCATEQTLQNLYTVVYFTASINLMVYETNLIKQSLGVLEMSHLTCLNTRWVSAPFVNWRHASFCISCHPSINPLVNWRNPEPVVAIVIKMGGAKKGN